MNKHVIAKGSRQHVISWVATSEGVQRVCSCTACENNRPAQDKP